MTWPTARRSAGDVSTRMFDPGTGWSLGEARELVVQGYSPEQAAKVSGYPVSMIRAGAPAPGLG